MKKYLTRAVGIDELKNRVNKTIKNAVLSYLKDVFKGVKVLTVGVTKLTVLNWLTINQTDELKCYLLFDGLSFNSIYLF